MAKIERGSFKEWIARPQALIALAAVLLSLCGLFISIYETSLIRRTQQASVWPHFEVGVSMRGRGAQNQLILWVQNVGVGPALIRSAAVTYEGELVRSWPDLLRRVAPERTTVPHRFSLISGRVFPGASGQETIFDLSEDDEDVEARAMNAALWKAIVDQRLDVAVCYCSVYDECWISRLQDLVVRTRAVTPSAGPREVDDCEREPRSGI